MLEFTPPPAARMFTSPSLWPTTVPALFTVAIAVELEVQVSWGVTTTFPAVSSTTALNTAVPPTRAVSGPVIVIDEYIGGGPTGMSSSSSEQPAARASTSASTAKAKGGIGAARTRRGIRDIVVLSDGRVGTASTAVGSGLKHTRPPAPPEGRPRMLSCAR